MPDSDDFFATRGRDLGEQTRAASARFRVASRRFEELAGGGSGTLDLTVPAVAVRVRAVRLAARAFAVEHGVARPDDVELAVGEACANAVVHAYPDGEPGRLRITGTRRPDHVEFVIE